MNIIERPSPNFEDRKEGAKPSLIILHYTGMKTGEDALDRLCDAEAKVSAHYVIEEDGRVFSLVSEDKRAWHAGQSYWQGESDVNSHSIGIEIVNPGHEFGYRMFPEEQVVEIMKLCHAIQARHYIKHVLAHSDIAPERKEDPGELFPWKRLAENGIGIWPEDGDGEGNVYQMLTEVGYAPSASEKELIVAFQRHYVPEVFDDNSQGQINNLTLSRLSGLHKLLTS